MESSEPLESKAEIEKRLKARQFSDWINDDGKKLADDIKKHVVRKCLPQIGKAGSKVAFKVMLNAIQAPDSVQRYLGVLIDNLY